MARPSAAALALPFAAATLVGLALTHCGGGSGGASGPNDATADSLESAAPQDAGLSDAANDGDATGGDAASDGDATGGDAASDGDATGGDAASDGDATGSDGSDGSEAEAGASDAAGLSDVVDAAIACDAADACSDSLSCCSSVCVDLHHDPRNCGTCGNGCGTSQFCTGTQCDDAVFVNVCANATGTVVTDPYTGDNEAGIALGQALVACADGGVAISIVPQTQAGVLIPADAGWRPNTGVGNTLVVGGGEYGQLSVAYMDDNGLTPVYLTNDGTTAHIYQRSTGLTLVTAADSALTSQHDFFLLELAVEPQSGTLCLFGQGIYGPGTLAAGYYGSAVVVPNHATSTAPWYVYEWTDTNASGVPDLGDTFTLVAHGP
jgi:hypothetical protein